MQIFFIFCWLYRAFNKAIFFDCIYEESFQLDAWNWLCSSYQNQTLIEFGSLILVALFEAKLEIGLISRICVRKIMSSYRDVSEKQSMQKFVFSAFILVPRYSFWVNCFIIPGSQKFFLYWNKRCIYRCWWAQSNIFTPSYHLYS